MFEKVLVAIDGSPHADAALKAARSLASLSQGEIRVVNVREVTPGRGGASETESREEASRLVDDAVRKLVADGLKASGTTHSSLAGRVASELLEEANQWGASVMVLATKGRSDLAGLVLGSTTHKVLHLGHLPVLVVR